MIIDEIFDYIKSEEPTAELLQVGGSIRDELVGFKPNDFDYVITGISEQRYYDLMFKYAHVCNTIGKIVHRFKGFDLTCTQNIDDDLNTRDFTINAIARNCANDTFYDPNGGIQDLRNGTLEVVNPEVFTDDPLRIMRGVRFCCVYGLYPTTKCQDLMFASANLILTVPMERIASELIKILNSVAPDRGINMLARLGVLGLILPEVARMQASPNYNTVHHTLDTFRHTLACLHSSRADATLRMALLLHDTGKIITESVDEAGVYHNYGHARYSADIARTVLTRLKFSNDYIDTVSNLVYEHHIHTFTTRKLRQLLSRYGKEFTCKLIDHVYCDRLSTKHPMTLTECIQTCDDVAGILAANDALKVTDLDIDGHDLMADGYYGPEIGKALKWLLAKVLINPSLNTRDQLMELLKEHPNAI